MTYRDDVPDGKFYARKVRALTDDIKLVFEWHGGAYIEVARENRGPSEVINVWDYETDQPTIPRTKQAMGRRITDWIGEYGRDDLIHDVKENWS